MNKMQQTAVTIGFFDGVHRGHRHLLTQLVGEARQRGLVPVVVTFDRMEDCLTTAEEKERMLGLLGIEQCRVLTLDKTLMAMSAEEFMRDVLKERMGARLLMVGCDNRFGRDRQEGYDDYCRYGNEMNIEVLRGEEMTEDGEKISSSQIRQLIGRGRVDEAARLLGYDYAIEGTVIHGRHIGTEIGFPTANISLLSNGKMIPAEGVYAVRVTVDGRTVDGLMNIGSNPTITDDGRMSLEVYMIDFNECVYDKKMRVEFRKWIRDERRFESVEALRAQIERDVENLKIKN